jgi:hypothetical protein
MVGISGLLTSDFFQAPSLPAMMIYRALEKTRDAQFARFEKQPTIQKDVAYFLDKAPKVKTVDEFLSDRRLMKVALTAFGLEDEMQYLGRMRKVLSESLTKPDALANKLADPRFKAIAKAFMFGDIGVGNLKLNFFRNEVIDGFLTNGFEKFLGEQNPALREAEYFRRKIGEVENTYNILGDRVLRSVVVTTFGLPDAIALQSIEKQKALIDARVKIKDLKDPAFVEKFIQRFLTQRDLAAQQQALNVGGDPILALLLGAGRVNLLA